MTSVTVHTLDTTRRKYVYDDTEPQDWTAKVAVPLASAVYAFSFAEVVGQPLRALEGAIGAEAWGHLLALHGLHVPESDARGIAGEDGLPLYYFVRPDPQPGAMRVCLVSLGEYQPGRYIAHFEGIYRVAGVAGPASRSRFGRKEQGGVMIGAAVLLWVLAILFAGRAAVDGAALRELRAHGVQVDARVADLRSESVRSGKNTFSRILRVSVEFDAKAAKPFVELPPTNTDEASPPASGAALIDRLFPLPPAPPDTRATLDRVSAERYAELRTGAIVPVVFLASDPTTAVEAEVVRTGSSWNMISGALLFMVVGGVLAILGFRRLSVRREPVTSPAR